MFPYMYIMSRISKSTDTESRVEMRGRCMEIGNDCIGYGVSLGVDEYSTINHSDGCVSLGI